jgi:predicted secreted protein
MLPERLVRGSLRHINRPDGPLSFEEAYQLSLELGASYRATLRRLHALKFINAQTAAAWFRRAPRDAKAAIVPATLVDDYRRDTIMLTPADERSELIVRDGDVLVVEVQERPTTGYLWDVSLDDLGHRVGDWVIREANLYGAPVTRRFAMQVHAPGTANLRMVHSRPWDRTSVIEERAIRVLSEPALRGRLWV